MLPLLPDAICAALWRAFHPTAWHLDTIGVRMLVARLGTDAVDGVLARAGLVEVDAPHSSADLMPPRPLRLVAQGLDALLPVSSSSVVPLVAVAIGLRDGRRHATAWLDAHPTVAAASLIPLALGAGPWRAGARGALQTLAQRGHTDVVTAAATTFGNAAVVDAVGALLAEDPLALAKRPKLPAWCVLSALAPVFTTTGERLGDDAVGIIVGAFAASTIDAPYAGLEAMAAAVTPQSLSALSWSVFRAWWWAGAPSGDGWVLGALGHVGDDAAAVALVDLMAVWAGDGLAARAKTGVQVLTTMANRHDAALLALFRFSGRAAAKSLARAATDAITAVGLARGLTTDELADRLVPDLGLDPDGTMALPLGDRTITLALDQLLRPILVANDGSRLATLPRTTSSMDAALVAEAKATIKRMTKAARDVGTHVLRRLEGALAEQRTWPRDVAVASLLRHPLVRHVARRLLWTDLDDDGTVLGLFRVAEDGTPADVDDTLMTLRGTCVGLAHPINLPPSVRDAWVSLWADYELQQPFAQLQRPVFVLDAAETGATLRRYVGRTVATGRLFTLEARGWQREAMGVTAKRLGGVGVALRYTPGIMGGPGSGGGVQTLGEVTLSDGCTWSALSPLQFSEVVYDLERMFTVT